MWFVVVSALLLASVSVALKVDPVEWTTGLDDNYQNSPTQWIATSAVGSTIVVDGKKLVALNPDNGTVLWTATHKDLDATNSRFAVSSSTVLVGRGTKLIGFDVATGALVGTVHVDGNGVSAIVVHQDLFVVSGDGTVAVFASDLSERYSIPSTRGSFINSVGASSGYLYFTSSDFESSSDESYLNIVDLATFAETRVNDVMQASTTDADGNILVLQNSKPILGYVSLATGSYVWRNEKVAHEFENFEKFVFIPSTDAPIVIGDNKVFAFDTQSGNEVFRHKAPFSTIVAPTINEGRLVYVGTGQEGPTGVVAVDLSTGKDLGKVITPTLSTPAVAMSGNNLVMVNGQGYSRINIRKMEAESYNLNIPGASAIAAVRLASNPSSTTFVIAGLLGASAVVLRDV